MIFMCMYILKSKAETLLCVCVCVCLLYMHKFSTMLFSTAPDYKKVSFDHATMYTIN